MAFTIRKMDARDLPTVHELCGVLGYQVTREELSARFGVITQHPEHALWVVEELGGVIAWAHVFLAPALTDKGRSEIAGLVVDKQFRKQGVGRALVVHCEQWAKFQGCELIRVRSQVMREGAHEFYTTLGYELKKIQNVFTKPLAT